MTRVLFPSWRDEHRGNRYPFATAATLSNGSQQVPPDMLLDAVLHPVGTSAGVYLKEVQITGSAVSFAFARADGTVIASASNDLLAPAASALVQDPAGRDAGLLIFSPDDLRLLGSWGDGTFTFRAEATELAAVVVQPLASNGLQGILVNGVLLSGPVWLGGANGVILQQEEVQEQVGTAIVTRQAIRVHISGDPLFVRRTGAEMPYFLKTLRIRSGLQTIDLTPDVDNGNVGLYVNNDLAADTVLRVRNDGQQLVIETVGGRV